ncbi:MAG TPA: hypothetical protein VMG12_40000 [Polyangiaceae bacterium]|nr:hypothetical protein [Polyangiaceae bacterium]
MVLHRRALLALLFVSSLAACAGDDAPTPERDEARDRVRISQNRGALCVTPTDAGVALEVVFDLCLSSTVECNELRSASCNASIAGSSIEVVSRAEVLRSDRPLLCASDCVPAAAPCGTFALSDGVYRVTHGSDRAELTLPFTGLQPLFAPHDECLQARWGEL